MGTFIFDYGNKQNVQWGKETTSSTSGAGENWTAKCKGPKLEHFTLSVLKEMTTDGLRNL